MKNIFVKNANPENEFAENAEIRFSESQVQLGIDAVVGVDLFEGPLVIECDGDPFVDPPGEIRLPDILRNRGHFNSVIMIVDIPVTEPDVDLPFGKVF